MKQKNNIWVYTIAIMLFSLTFTTSCTKEEEPLPDYASAITGMYDGTITIDDEGEDNDVTVSGSSTLSKKSEQEVDLEITIGTTDIPLNGIDVSKSDDGSYVLSYTDISGSFTGKVEGDVFTWTLIAGDITETFSGTK